MDDSVPWPGSPWRLRSFLALASIWKTAGKLTSVAEPRRHLPSGPHSVTAVVPQIMGADPSNLPAAPVDGRRTPPVNTPRMTATVRTAFAVLLQLDLSRTRSRFISSP